MRKVSSSADVSANETDSYDLSAKYCSNSSLFVVSFNIRLIPKFVN